MFAGETRRSTSSTFASQAVCFAVTTKPNSLLIASIGAFENALCVRMRNYSDFSRQMRSIIAALSHRPRP